MDEYTVLFVDDEPNILRSLTRLFRNDPVKLITANCAKEALDVFESQRVHLLMTDNKMPGMTGVELIKKIKEISPDTVRIILSGQSDMDAVLKAVNEGEAFRFVLKPWTDIDLKITVSIALAQYRLVEENRELVRELRMKTKILDDLRTRHPELFSIETGESVREIDDSPPDEPAVVASDKED